MNIQNDFPTGADSINLQKMCDIQRVLMQEYCDAKKLTHKEGAKVWVAEYAQRCRDLLEKGVNSFDELKNGLYNDRKATS